MRRMMVTEVNSKARSLGTIINVTPFCFHFEDFCHDFSHSKHTKCFYSVKMLDTNIISVLNFRTEAWSE